MAESHLQKLISEIPPRQWEEALPIGKFQAIENLQQFSRPFSFISKCRVVGDRGERNVYIKLYRNPRDKDESLYSQKIREDYRIARHWYEKFADSTRFRVVKPLFAFPEKFLFVTEESRGKNLFHLLLSDARALAAQSRFDTLSRYVENVGEWLRYKMQVMDVADASYSLEGLWEYVLVRLRILSSEPHRNFPKHYLNEIRRFFEQRAKEVPEEHLRVSYCHSDFNPGNILVEGDQVTVLDFGRLVKESHLLDVSKLYFQIHILTFKPQYRKAQINKLQQALLAGFREPQAEREMIFRMLTIRNILTHMTAITRPGARSLPEQLYNKWVQRKELQMLDHLLNDH